MAKQKTDQKLAEDFKIYLNRNIRTRLHPEQEKLRHFFGALDIALSNRLFTLKDIGMSKVEMQNYKKKLIEVKKKRKK